ncbi:MAG: phosphatidylglycerophosphatase A [Planctomycetes bacterium]|nr:phosphatidylglycerophosphatase A [Planctomycetota bacterium]
MSIARLILSYGGFGLSPKAPGTTGTLGAALTAAAIMAWAPGLTREWQVLAGAWILLASLLTVLLTPVLEAETGEKDPGVIVMDEVAGYWATLLFVQHPGWTHLVAAFFLFRFLDVLKPWPAWKLEQLPSGWGVLLDDVAAGLYGGVALWAIERFTTAA